MKRLMRNPKKVLPQLLATVIASMAYFCLGLVRGWSSPGIPSLNATLHESENLPNSTNYFDMSNEDLTWVSSLPPLSAIFGSLMIMALMQYFGRKAALIMISIPYILGFLLMGFTYFVRHKSTLFIGGILTGLVVGSSTPAAQIYIAECSSPRVRGVMGSFTASLLALGILVVYIIGAFVPWYVLCWILGSFPLILLVGMLFLPETPIWLLAHNRENDARNALQRLRGKKTDIEVEFQRIKMNLTKTNVNGVQQSIKLKELLKGSVLKPFGISLGLMFFQQFTGINAIVFYMVNIFTSSGSSIEPHFAAIICGAVQFLATALFGSLVDRFGRKVLLLVSGLVVSISLAALGSFFYFQNLWGNEVATASLEWLPLVSLIVFFIAYSGGFANVPFIIMGELFPSRFRTILGPATSSFNLLCAFIVVRSFPAMTEGIGKYGTFWFFMCCSVAGLLFIFFFLPETKGKTLEEIERMFTRKIVRFEDPARHNNSYWKRSPVAVMGVTNPGFYADEEIRQSNNTSSDGEVEEEREHQFVSTRF